VYLFLLDFYFFRAKKKEEMLWLPEFADVWAD
jgi:hypothetical protein